MILSVSCRGEWRHVESWDEIRRLSTEVLDGLRGEECEGASCTPGDDAWFCLANGRVSDGEPVVASNLRVALNEHTGYGALVWFADEGFPKRTAIYESVWVSDNPQPVAADPRVVSDPGYPLFHDPASALPVTRIRAAVEEFCRERSGERPKSLDWVVGHMNGQRLDRPPIVEFVEDPETDWDSLR
ncbi:Imm1 family immunity protein [Streptomyces sp. NPDC001832]|uniref:Imm1 family immunity protein n=1 Tax=Streptomyces sp. NPDC001832 TaxID=3154527 RepID=UPI0033336318